MNNVCKSLYSILCLVVRRLLEKRQVVEVESEVFNLVLLCGMEPLLVSSLRASSSQELLE